MPLLLTLALIPLAAIFAAAAFCVSGREAERERKPERLGKVAAARRIA